jgi:hypothetical protein
MEGTNVSMEYVWDDTNRKAMYLDWNLSQSHYVHKKLHMKWTRIKPGAVHVGFMMD